MGDPREPFDDLFEPFELEETPPDEPSRQDYPPAEDYAPAQGYPPDQEYEQEVPVVACPSCGTHNPVTLRHCVECGARIAQGPLPVAPQPLVRTTAGGRALLVMAAVVAVVAISALIWNVIRGGDEDGGTAAETTLTPTTAAGQVPVGPVTPASVTALTALTNFPAGNLTDGDPTTEWQAGSAGEGASLTFTFAQPVELQAIQIQNIVDPGRFVRNYRIKGYRLKFNDVTQVETADLADSQDLQTIPVSTIATTRVTLDVTSTYPAQGDSENPPFNELAVAEITFVGRPSAVTP